MSAYQKLKEFQDEVERMTGLRPSVDIQFTAFDRMTNDDCEEIRNYFVDNSRNELRSIDLALENPAIGEWTVFKAQNASEGVNISVHGPRVLKEIEACEA